MKILAASTTTVLGSVFAFLFLNRRVSGQQSCVQTVDAIFSACPCDAAEFSFSIVGETSVANNTVSSLDAGHDITDLHDTIPTISKDLHDTTLRNREDNGKIKFFAVPIWARSTVLL